GFAVGAPVSSLELMLGTGVLFIAFQGFEVVAQLSDQVKHPESSIPRGVFAALALAFLVYAGFFIAILGNVPAAALTNWPNCTACVGGSEDMALLSLWSFLGQPYVRGAVLVIGSVSVYRALNSTLTAAITACISVSRDGLLPGTPRRSPPPSSRRPSARPGSRPVSRTTCSEAAAARSLRPVPPPAPRSGTSWRPRKTAWSSSGTASSSRSGNSRTRRSWNWERGSRRPVTPS